MRRQRSYRFPSRTPSARRASCPMTASPSKGGHACLSALALDWLHRRLAPDDCEPIHPGRTISAEGLCRRDKYGRARHRSHGGAALWRVPCSRRPKVRRGAALPAPMWARAATSELGWARAPMSCSAARNARSLSSRSRSKGRVGVTSPWGFRNSSSARRHDAMRAASSRDRLHSIAASAVASSSPCIDLRPRGCRRLL